MDDRSPALNYRSPEAVNARLAWKSTAVIVQLIGIVSAAFGGLMLFGFVVSLGLVMSLQALLFFALPGFILAAGLAYVILGEHIARRSRRSVMATLVIMALHIGLIYSLILPDVWRFIRSASGHWVWRVEDPAHVLALTALFLGPPTLAVFLLPRMIRLLRPG